MYTKCGDMAVSYEDMRSCVLPREGDEWPVQHEGHSCPLLEQKDMGNGLSAFLSCSPKYSTNMNEPNLFPRAAR